MAKSAPYPVRWLLVSLGAILCIAFFPYIFQGRIFLPTDIFDTMIAPFNAHYGPAQAQNFYLLDGIVQTYPWKIAAQEAMRSGHIAYWNSHILCGYPQYADSDSFDVFNIFGLWFGTWHTILIEALVEFFLAGAGMCLLLRLFGIQPAANLMFSSAYMLNSLFVATPMSRWAVAAFCWTPFVVLMLVRYFRESRKEEALYASLFLALSYLGGTLQTAFFVTCIAACLIFFYPSGNGAIRLYRRIGILSVVLAISFVLSAVMWLPTVQLFAQTLLRGSLNSTSIYANYTIVQRLLSLPLLILFYFPELTGSPEIFNLKKFAGADATDFNGAIFFVPMLFALWACFALWKRKEIFPFILLAACAILLPIFTPLYSILYHRVFIVATLCFSIVGAVMFQSFLDCDMDQVNVTKVIKRIAGAFSLFIFAMTVICGYITIQRYALSERLTGMLKASALQSAFDSSNNAWQLARVGKTLDYYSFTSVDLWIPIILAAIALEAIYRYAIRRLSARAFLWITGIATIAPLIFFVRMWLPSIDPNEFPIYPANNVTTFLQNHSSEGRYMVWQDLAKDAYILRPNISDVYGMNDFEGYESMNSGTMSVFYQKHISQDSLDLRLLGLANVKYIVARSHVISSTDVIQVFTADGLTIYENRLCKPRAYFATKVKSVVSDSDISTELLRSDFVGTTALVNRKEAQNKLEENYSTGEISQIRDDGTETVLIKASAPSKAFLVLTDTYYPGWKCYVNGVSRPVYRVNDYMRGIILDAGKSEIEFRFEPDIFSAGAATSGIAAICFLIAIVVLKLRKRNKRHVF